MDAVVQTLLLLYAAAVFAVLLNGIVGRLPSHRKGIAALVGLVIFAAIGLALWFGIPALISQFRDITAQVPRFTEVLQDVESWIRENTGLNVQLVGADAEARLRDWVTSTAAGGQVLGRAQSLLGFLVVPLIILFGGLFAVADPNNRLLNPVLRAVPRDRRLAFRRMFELMAVRIFGWLRGVLIGMVAIGLLSFVAYSAIGVPNALLLAVANALLEAIPLLGPIVGGAIAVILAFLDDPTKAIWALLAATAIQQIENNLIIPFAMSREANLHPFVTLFALVLFGSLFGFLGVLLAVPLILLFWTLIQVLWVERALDTDRDPIQPVAKD